MKNRKVLVLGATGNQGGAVVKALLKDKHSIVGVARNVESPKAQNLIDQGVEMASADFTDKANAYRINENGRYCFCHDHSGMGRRCSRRIKTRL